MTTYALFRGAVRSAVVLAAGVHDRAVVWAQNGPTHADPVIILQVISDVRTSGVPTRRTLTEAGGAYIRSLSEMRDVVVQVRVESCTEDALHLANRCAMRLGFQGPRGVLEAQEIAVIEDPDNILDLRYTAHDLVVQARVFEFRCRMAIVEVDPVPVGTIQTAQVQGSPIEADGDVITLDEDTIPDPL